MARKKSTFPGTIYVPAGANRIYIEYYPQDGSKRKRIATGLRPSKEGYEVAETMLKRIYLSENKILRTHETPEKEVTPPKEIDFETAFADFIRIYCVNKSPRTIVNYEEGFKKIFSSVKKLSVSDHEFENSIVEFVGSSSLAATSVNIYLRSVQVFAGFCARKGYVQPRNYYQEFSLTEQRKEVQIFMPEEVAAMLETMRKRGRTDLAQLVQFLLETGFRIGQALNLQWTDIKDGLIYRNSKHGERYEPFPITVSLQKLFDAMPRHSTKPNKVFFWEMSSQAAISRDFNKILAESGIEKQHRNWHTFRKTAASYWAAQGLPLQEVQRLLGHTSVEITNSYYTKVNMDSLREKLEKIT